MKGRDRQRLTVCVLNEREGSACVGGVEFLITIRLSSVSICLFHHYQEEMMFFDRGKGKVLILNESTLIHHVDSIDTKKNIFFTGTF